MTFSIRLNSEERKLASSYAKMNSMTLGEAFKTALFEKIEDEYDAKVFDECVEEYERDGFFSKPIADLWEELDI